VFLGGDWLVGGVGVSPDGSSDCVGWLWRDFWPRVVWHVRVVELGVMAPFPAPPLLPTPPLAPPPVPPPVPSLQMCASSFLSLLLRDLLLMPLAGTSSPLIIKYVRGKTT
jgi:hypothetical protein